MERRSAGFYYKNGGIIHIGGLSIEGEKALLFNVIYGFFSNTALYSASLSLVMFIFLVTLFDTLLLFLIKSQPSIAYKSVFYNKACNLVLQSSKHEEITFPYESILSKKGKNCGGAGLWLAIGRELKPSVQYGSLRNRCSSRCFPKAYVK